jgi:hypothetical protein
MLENKGKNEGLENKAGSGPGIQRPLGGRRNAEKRKSPYFWPLSIISGLAKSPSLSKNFW